MQRLACLLIVIAGCGGGTPTEAASLTGAMPTIKSSAAKPFTDTEGNGMNVLGWDIELYADKPGADCTSSDTNVVANLAIFTNQAAGSGPMALLEVGGIVIVPVPKPPVQGTAAAALGVMGVIDVSGLVEITEFHLTDLTHADRIKGTISAGGHDPGTMADVSLTGDFTAPVCLEE